MTGATLWVGNIYFQSSGLDSKFKIKVPCGTGSIVVSIAAFRSRCPLTQLLVNRQPPSHWPPMWTAQAVCLYRGEAHCHDFLELH